jgi:isoquinoline 1-oxidoreductase alpha subunit
VEKTMTYLMINGQIHEVDVPDDMPLLWIRRDVPGTTGTKFGCGIGQCGACTVHLAGEAVRSCLLPAGTIGGRPVITIEAVGATANGRKVQQTWLANEVVHAATANADRSWRRQRS